MRILVFIQLIALLPGVGFTQKKVQLAVTPVHFTISNAGFTVHGTIEGFEGFILLDSQSAVLTGIEGSVDAGTIQTGIELRDKHLKKAGYFNVKEFPRIFMASTQIKKGNDIQYIGDFTLTIKGITKTISVPFTFSVIHHAYVLKGGFPINRLDFKLGEESTILSNTVTITIECTGKLP